MKITFLTAFMLSVALFAGATAQACQYHEDEVKRNLAASVFIGKVKIIKVEKNGKDGFNRPTVTYEIVETEKRAPGFDNDVVIIEGAPLSSCDHAGPWKIGAVVDEAFFIEDGKLRPETLNMKVRHMSGIAKEE